MERTQLLDCGYSFSPVEEATVYVYNDDIVQWVGRGYLAPNRVSAANDVI